MQLVLLALALAGAAVAVVLHKPDPFFRICGILKEVTDTLPSTLSKNENICFSAELKVLELFLRKKQLKFPQILFFRFREL